MQDQQGPAKKVVPKKLIVCCDGTWRNSNSGILSGSILAWLYRGEVQTATNVTRISQAIRVADSEGRQQIVYYQAGVGSSGNIIQRVVGGALGAGLSANIREAYSFIANNYAPGDEIYLIGFSRGAFTARSVGGMIGDLGLLTTGGQEHLVDIFQDWEQAGNDRWKTMLSGDVSDFPVKKGMADPVAFVKAYRKGLLGLKYTRDAVIPIKAIAVWETVGSLGIPVNPLFQRLGLPTVLRDYRFYDTNLGSNVENAFQALALDEARSPYRPVLWQKLPSVQASLEQTWFPGVHTDVGGGYPDTGLSDITLAWMMSKLSPFIDFTPDFCKAQNNKHVQFLKQEKAPAVGFKWAASRIQISASVLRELLGVTKRTPGRYNVLSSKTLTYIKDQPLQNTNEHIHFAVRSREKTGGLNVKNKVVNYEPKALPRSDYQLERPDSAPGQASWRYIGREKSSSDIVLPEDELGVFEKEIFVNPLTAES